MAYVVPIHQPSSIRHALKLQLLGTAQENLVVAKSNRLEVYEQTQDGLVHKHSKTVYGRITMLHKLRPASAATDHLFVGTDRFMYFTLSWNPNSKQLHTERSFVDQADSSARDSQTGERCHIEPSGSFMTLELFEGIVIVIPIGRNQKKDVSGLEVGNLGEPTPVRIPEMFVRASTFFTSKAQEDNTKPKMALLYEDNYKHVKLKVRELAWDRGFSGDGPTVDLEEVEGYTDDLELGMSHLIPVDAPACGLIILGETSITYWEHSTKQSIRRPLREATIFVAWERIDSQRYVLSDEYGKLYLFMLQIDTRDHITGWQLDVLGEISKASALVYLGDNRVFVASHQGDSQVIAIQPQALEIRQTLPNIAPILDFSIMDLGNRSGEGHVNEFSSGQARLVTGSGAFKDGSLRSVRSGVGLEDLGLLDQVENVTSLFSFASNPSASSVDTLVVSFVDESRVFHFGADGDVEELESFKSLRLDAGTLFVGNVAGDKIVQITSSETRLIDRESGMVVGEWSPPSGKSITTLAANDAVAALVVGGSVLVALDFSQSLAVIAERSFENDAQVACLNMQPQNAALCAVAFWGSSAISVLSMSDFKTLHTSENAASEAAVPRDLLIANIFPGQDPTLFVAMADGQVITYSMHAQTGQLSNPKSIVLGTQQAKFHALPRSDGLFNVFATCEQPSLIYASEGRMVYSAVTAEAATCVCPFNSQSYPGAIAVATKSELKISIIDEERSTHVQGTHVGETVRRIARSPTLKAFGLGTISRTLEDGVEVVQSHFKLADEVTFQVQATFLLNEDELVESVMRAELPNGHGGLAERFVVGTAYIDDETVDAVRGRIIVLEVTEDRHLKTVAELAVKGACRCLAMANGMIVAALIKTVVVYSLDYETASTPDLVKQCSYRTSTAPIDLAVSTNEAGQPVIAIADLMKSLSLITYMPPKTPGGPPKLIETGRHFQTLWATAVALVDEHTYLEADAEGNLLVLRQDVAGVTAEDKRRLGVTSELCLGEVVNRIRRIDVATAPDAPVVPRAFIATVEGSIFLFGVIRSEWQDRLMRLQGALAKLVQSPGHVPFGAWRGFRNQVREESDPFRFVDGELLEGFLGIDESLQEEIVAEAGLVESVGVEKMRAVLEGLRRLR